MTEKNTKKIKPDRTMFGIVALLLCFVAIFGALIKQSDLSNVATMLIFVCIILFLIIDSMPGLVKKMPKHRPDRIFQPKKVTGQPITVVSEEPVKTEVDEMPEFRTAERVSDP